MKALVSTLKAGAEEGGVLLSGSQLDRLALFAAELCKWNRKINLTSIVKPEEIAIKHFIDSLMPTKYLDMRGRLLDIGSGGGFPCLPLKIAFPDMDIVSVDAVEKKIHFQRHVARLLGLARFSALHRRVENLSSEYHGAFNLVVSRAFSDLAEFARVALPFLTEGGLIVAMKGKDGVQEAEKAGNFLDGSGLTVLAAHEFSLPQLQDARSLIIIGRKS